MPTIIYKIKWKKENKKKNLYFYVNSCMFYIIIVAVVVVNEIKFTQKKKFGIRFHLLDAILPTTCINTNSSGLRVRGNQP